MSVVAPRSPALRDPEPWKTIHNTPFSHWDLWLLVCSLIGEATGLDGIERKLRDRINAPGGHLRDDSEAKLSHLDDLRARLAMLGMQPEDIALEEARDKKIVRKARTKIFEGTASLKDFSEPMRNTPRARLSARAMSGRWDKFPVSPASFASSLFEIVHARDHHSVGQSFTLAKRLAKAWRSAAEKADQNPEQSLALHRAMLAVCHAAQERTNDSCGAVGEVFTAAIRAYRSVPWEQTGIAPEIYLRDIIEFAVWEQYGQGDELEELFKAVDPKHGDLAVRIFAGTVDELESFGLFEYQVQSARAHWTALLVGLGRFDEFVALANMIGSSQWRPIVTMAEAAMKAKKVELTMAIFGAANKRGMHRAVLAEECERVTGEKMPSVGLLVASSKAPP